MISEKITVRCEAVFSDDHMHRFLWKRVWDKDKPQAAVLMLNPCQADTIITDTTTSLVVNNVARAETYGGVIIINLYSLLTSKLNLRWNSDDELNDPANDSYIMKAAEESAVVIMAWGKAAETNQRIAARAEQVTAMLSKHQEKLKVISDGERDGLHPLTPSVRSEWKMKPFVKREAPIANAETTPNSSKKDPA